jgi:hypothetical protein
MRNATTQKLALQEALRVAQRNHIVLIPTCRSVKLFASGVRVPAGVRQTIATHKKDVLKMLDIADIAVCPSPEIHYPGWSYFAEHHVCSYCSRIDRAMRGLN